MKFEDYYQKIGVTKKENGTLDKLSNVACSICLEEIERAFISQDQVENGKYKLGDLWFFSKSYALRFAADWETSKHPRISLLPLNVQWLSYEDYDLFKNKATPILEVKVKFKGKPFGEQQGVANFRAVSENCDDLKEIIKNYLKPKISP
jgi:hypothetical protein